MTVLIAADAPALRPSADLGDVVELLRSIDPERRRVVETPGRHRGSGGHPVDGGGHRAEMEAFATAHDDALARTCLSGHFTGSAFVVDADAERCLLLFHRKLQRWLQPGGHADGDANLAGVALREATEETGIEGLVIDPDPVDLDIHEIPARREPAHRHLDVRFLVVAPRDAVVVGNHESEGLQWVPEAELANLDLDPGLHRLAAAAFARARSAG